MNHRQRGSGQKSYEATPDGIVIRDKRQMTNGPITPNYLIDLYLPIIGFQGIGLLTTLYRVAINNDRAVTKLKEIAHAGRMGFNTLDSLLGLLDELRILKVNKPTGASKGMHRRTEIILLDAPSDVPEKFAATVLDRTLTRWMIGRASFQSEPGQVPDRNSPGSNQRLASFQSETGEFPTGTFMYKEDVPIHDVPMLDVPTHTERASGARECGEKSSGENLSKHPFDVIHKWAKSQSGLNSPFAYARVLERDGKADKEIDLWLTERAEKEKSSAGESEALPDLPGSRDDELLERFLASVASKVNAESLATWFKPILQLNRDGASLFVLVPSPTIRDWNRDNYFDVIEEVLEELGLSGSKVEFVAKEQNA